MMFVINVNLTAITYVHEAPGATNRDYFFFFKC